MGGGSDSAPVTVTPTNSSLDKYKSRAELSSDPKIAGILADYGSGKISLQDAMSQGRAATAPLATDAPLNSGDPLTDNVRAAANNYATGQNNIHGGDTDEFMSLLQTDPAAASRYNQDHLMNDDATKGLFGQGGMLDKSEVDYGKAMGNVNSDSAQYQSVLDDMKAGKGLQLNQDDQKLYGDLSGNVARTMGSQEQALQQSLADRGLASAPNGVANQEFSGIYGNKFEQLGQLQDQIAMNRVNQAMQLYQTQLSGISAKGNLDLSQEGLDSSTAMGLSGQYQNAMSNMFNRAMAGRNNQMSELAAASGLTLQGQEAQQNALNEQFAQQQATKTPSFGDVMAGAGENFVGNFAGSLGSSLGKNIGSGGPGASSGGSSGAGMAAMMA